MSVSLNIGHTPNYATVEIGSLTLHFSYRTVIAFDAGDGLVVRQNDWATTTGKHLNAIDGGSADAKARRIPGREFEAQLQEIVGRVSFSEVNR
jgi:hypothetical protein